jgi:hypothetical protein
MLAAGAGALLSLTAFGVISLGEGERRAARISFILAAAISLPCFVVAALPPPAPLVGTAIIVIAMIVAVVLWFVPVARLPVGGGRPSRRVDERDIMFARGRLVPGSPEYELYYAMRPQNKQGDDHTRSLPGLLSPDAELAEPIAFAAAEACFDLTEALRDHVDGDVAERRVERAPDEWTAALGGLARSLGAVDVGVTELEPYHVYTHVGRGSGVYGEAVDLGHRWAFAFTVEMDHRRISQAPAPPVVEESARQYVEGARQLQDHCALGGERCRPWRDRTHGSSDDAAAGPEGASGRGDHRPAAGGERTGR